MTVFNLLELVKKNLGILYDDATRSALIKHIEIRTENFPTHDNKFVLELFSKAVEQLKKETNTQ